MYNIYNYNQFITEASLNDSKIMVDYQLSRSGRTKAMKFSTSVNIDSSSIKFKYSDESPSDDEEVLWIKSSSLSKIKLSDLKIKLNIGRDEMMVYKIESDYFESNWAVAKKGINSTMVKQLNRKGSSKRGDYFRETAFIIMLSIEAWKAKGVKIPVHTHRGNIIIDYKYDGTASMSSKNSKDFVDMYDGFVNDRSKKLVIDNMAKHCTLLINYLGENISKVSYVIKNHKDMLINMMAQSYLKDEVETRKEIDKEVGVDLSEYGFYNMPELTNISKWNPSDIWIVFDDDILDNKSFYENNDIDSLDDLNDFLYRSLASRDGIVGVSLKQSKKTPRLYDINSDNRKIVNKFNDFDIKGSTGSSDGRKTAKIDFSYKDDKGWKKGAGIDIRTFDSSNKSSIQIEVKGSPGSGYVSGKAGSMINHLLPKDLKKKKDIIRRGVDKEEIRQELEEEGGLVVKNDKLKAVYDKDLSGDGTLSNKENSRLQSVIFIDWLLSLSDNKRNEVINDIVRFAKSESVWSAPHIVLK